MTDQEKIQKIVEFMGGWPGHKRINTPYGGTVCVRSPGVESVDLVDTSRCHSFNPFTRIEDAFLVVERLRYQGIYLKMRSYSSGYIAFDTNESTPTSVDGDPACAIAEAAYQVIDKLEFELKKDLWTNPEETV